MAAFKYSWLDFALTGLSLVFLLIDIGLDIYAVASFYQEQAYVSLCILLLFLLGSSVLVQAFSWLWYSYEDFKRDTKVGSCLSPRQLMLLHVFQLGIYFRHAGVVEVSVQSFSKKNHDPKDVHKEKEGFAVYLTHDLSLLRLIETFSESSPQLVLMLTIMMQQGQSDTMTVLKTLGSVSAIAISVTMYHRSLRSFLPNKENQQFISSVVYFFWNVLLISSRLTALALFASVLPCFIFTHFFCSWLVLFFFVWRCKTDLMDTPGGEWLYRATTGLIWYFTWFNVVEGRTLYRSLLYHGYTLVDISLLCSLCYWKISTEPSSFKMSCSEAIIYAVIVVSTYICGLICKGIYYKCCHPKLAKQELKGVEEVTTDRSLSRDEVDFSMPENHVTDLPSDFTPETLNLRELSGVTDVTDVTDRNWQSPPAGSAKRYNKRMRKLAENFYT